MPIKQAIARQNASLSLDIWRLLALDAFNSLADWRASLAMSHLTPEFKSGARNDFKGFGSLEGRCAGSTRRKPPSGCIRLWVTQETWLPHRLAPVNCASVGESALAIHKARLPKALPKARWKRIVCTATTVLQVVVCARGSLFRSQSGVFISCFH